jgi:uncharacterized protein (DUF302 family)
MRPLPSSTTEAHEVVGHLADPRVGIELPLRMLIWEDPDGTHVGYLDPRELADRYALDGHQQTLERQSAVLTKLAAAAAI